MLTKLFWLSESKKGIYKYTWENRLILFVGIPIWYSRSFRCKSDAR